MAPKEINVYLNRVIPRRSMFSLIRGFVVHSYIALNKAFLRPKSTDIFSYFSTKACGTHQKRLTSALHITKTCLYSFDPLKPHFYIVKLRFTGVYIIFLISAQNIDCGYSLEPPRRGGSNEYPQSIFWAEIWKILEFFIWKFANFWL